MKQRRNLPKLIEVYRAIERYQAENEDGFPSMSDLVEMGIALSTNTIRYYFMEMGELKMLEYKRVIARSSRLLPLEKADPRIRELL